MVLQFYSYFTKRRLEKILFLIFCGISHIYGRRMRAMFCSRIQKYETKENRMFQDNRFFCLQRKKYYVNFVPLKRQVCIYYIGVATCGRGTKKG